MKKIDKVRAGDLIAHWRLAPTAEDIAAVKGIVKDAVRRCGLNAAVRVATCKMECPSLGHGNIIVKLSIRNPKPAFRTAAKTLVKGLTTIMVEFEKCAGLFDFNAHGKRNNEEEELLASLPLKEAFTAIDNLKWDATSVHFSGKTNGKARKYRHHHYYPYEGRGHFDYGAEWADLVKPFTEYIGGIVRAMGGVA